MSIRKRVFALAAAGATALILGGLATAGHQTTKVEASGPLISGIGCANSAAATDVAFTAPAGSGILSSGIQITVTAGTVPASLAINTPLGAVECGAVFQDTNVANAANATDADPNTIDGGTITYALSTAPANTTTLTGQPVALILESNTTTANVACGSTGAPTVTVTGTTAGAAAVVGPPAVAAVPIVQTTAITPGGLESCQGAVAGAGTISVNPGNLVHVAFRSGASFGLIGGVSPVITITATYTRFSSIVAAAPVLAGTCVAPAAGVPACVAVGIALTGNATVTTGFSPIGVATPVYAATLTAAPNTIPAASGTGQGSTLTAAIYHTAVTGCAGIAGFVVTVPGGFVVCPTAAAIGAGAAGAILQTAAGGESGVVTFTTTSGVFGSTSATPGTSSQQVFSTHCGQLPNTSPIILLPNLGLPFTQSTSGAFVSACLTATAVLYGGGAAGTAVVAANYVGDFTGGTAVATQTVQLSPTGNTTNLSRGCNEVITPASTAAGATVAAVAGLVQPGGIVQSVWQFNNSLHAFGAGFFSTAGAPTDFGTTGPGQSLFICVSGSGSFPTGAF